MAQITGLVFVPAGLVKFVFHAWELHAFRAFGIPAASIMEPIVGVLETLGGVLLLTLTLVAPTAFVLAVIMLVAFVAGGLIHGSPIPSDTLAPALLVAMIYLLVTELRSRPTAVRARPHDDDETRSEASSAWLAPARGRAGWGEIAALDVAGGGHDAVRWHVPGHHRARGHH